MTIIAPAVPAAERREEWVGAVTELVQQVANWADLWVGEYDGPFRDGEYVRQTLIEKHESLLGGSYSVPMLEISPPRNQQEGTPGKYLVLEPVAYNVAGSDGRVDFYALPGLNRVMLLRSPELGWFVRTDSGVNWPHPWNQETFIGLAEALLRDS